MRNHKMLLISTGGTIAGEVSATKRDQEAGVSDAKAFSDLIKDTVAYQKHAHGIQITIEPDEYLEVDSSDIKPEHWTGLARRVEERFDEFDSFVITHGTNTLGYTCAALSFALVNPGKPIVLTGSQVPIDQPGSDAKTNLDNAIRVATWHRHTIRGVLCVFGSHIITGTRVKKDTEFDYDAFKSFSSGSVGRIGRIIDMNEANLNKHNGYHQTAKYPVANSRSTLRCENEFETRIVSLTEFPGMNYSLLKDLFKSNRIKGFIVRAFGAGDMSTVSQDVLRYLRDQEVPVVVTTQAPNGNATLQVNEPGQQLKDEELVIPAYDMSIESQTAKLMWLLAKKADGEINFAQLKERMTEDIRGEINVLWEADYGE